MVDIHGAYKEALFRSYAEDTVARDEEARRKKKLLRLLLKRLRKGWSSISVVSLTS